MRALVLVVVLFLAACGNASQPAVASPSVTNTSSPTSRPMAVSSPSAIATASPISSPPHSPLASDLTCRLPVISPTTSSDPVPGGWITFPDGQFTRDPASLPGRLQSHVPSYDRAIGRWVPVEYKNVSPDGTSYILHGDQSLPSPSLFYLVDARTGTRQLLLAADGPPKAPGSWEVVRYSSAGVYLWSVGILTVPGLWLLDPRSGVVRLVDGSHYWGMVDGDAAWAVDPPFGGGPGSIYTIYRLDLATGQVTTWYHTNVAMSLLSPTPDGSVLIVYGEIPSTSARLGLIAAPDQLVSLGVLPIGVGTPGYLSFPGIWIPLQPGGLALYVTGQAVAIMTPGPAIFSVAGDCQ